MKNSFKIYLFSLLIFTNFMICSSQEVQRYYVDSTNGSDDNNGFLEGAAWQSIGKVNQSTFLPGDEILFKSGQEFFGKLIPPSSGDSSNLIIFGKYGGNERPTINGKNYKIYRI